MGSNDRIRQEQNHTQNPFKYLTSKMRGHQLVTIVTNCTQHDMSQENLCEYFRIIILMESEIED